MIRKIVGPLIKHANEALAKKPRFVVIGTPRSGTTYFSALCRANGVICSHEKYFTEHGPRLRNGMRRFDAIGDVSWLAPPFLPDPDIITVHQVRHPLKVIRSIHELGLFHPAHEHSRKAFVAFAKRHFKFSNDPLRSSIRFYIEWNERCERITDKRFRIEDLDTQTAQLEKWLGIKLNDTTSVSRTTNKRVAEVNTSWDLSNLQRLPEYPALERVAERYGYEMTEIGTVAESPLLPSSRWKADTHSGHETDGAWLNVAN